jgi:cytochrome c oxidase accessory protein FixG
MSESLDPNKLSMLDHFGQRMFIIPAEVKGYFQRRKEAVHLFLLGLFLVLPWIQIHGHQAVLLDIPGRQFNLFGLRLFAYDFPLFFLVIFSFAVLLFLLTALFGRVWCGWACPQTVFIEAIYRRIEIWIEGNYIERRKLQAQEMNLMKFFKAVLKWSLYFIVSAAFAHSFVAYFSGSAPLIKMMQGSPSENMTYFTIVAFVTALTLFDFGWFREQFCLIMCPYGRFQSVLQDPQTVTVLYDFKRGEPRKGLELPGQSRGDCVSCGRCVEVCPTGIDIRRGAQMECIGCTACIDACDEIMRKVKKPEGLISYRSEKGGPISWLRPRVILYSLALIGALAALTFLLENRQETFVEILRSRGLPYEIENSGGLKKVENHFKFRLENHSDHPLHIHLKPLNHPEIHWVLANEGMDIPANSKIELPIFAEVSESAFASSNEIKVLMSVSKETEDGKGEEILQQPLSVLGPSSPPPPTSEGSRK